ncbi:MAG TPA: DUF4160 domain-containing protein [Candidatus Tectomicrobia bacterium]|nr:DUF4160 domain-containing protein [Candidatus Tectomicrobia bacterium]
MPTVLRTGPYRLFFYSGDRDEPRHVHVERDANRAKFRLDPVRLADSGGFGRAEIRRVEAVLRDNAVQLRRAWDEYFTQ